MVKKRLVLTFPHKLLDKPIVYKLAKEYNLIFNILQAKVTPEEEGIIILELSGKKENYAEGIRYLCDNGIDIQLLSKGVIRKEEICTHCGACVSVCPTGALAVDRKTMMIGFNASDCIACELCVRTCPPRAMEVKF